MLIRQHYNIYQSALLAQPKAVFSIFLLSRGFPAAGTTTKVCGVGSRTQWCASGGLAGHSRNAQHILLLFAQHISSSAADAFIIINCCAELAQPSTVFSSFLLSQGSPAAGSAANGCGVDCRSQWYAFGGLARRSRKAQHIFVILLSSFRPLPPLPL